MAGYHYVGDSYHNFLEKNLPQYVYIKGQDGFNMSALSINDKEELYCFRMIGRLPAYFGEEIIPGNYSETTIPKILQYVRSIGKNFFWNHWMDRGTNDATIFFVGSFVDGKIIINNNILPKYFQNVPVYQNKPITKNTCPTNSSSLLSLGDIRLFRSGKKIFYYDGNVSMIQEILITDNEIILTGKNLYIQTFLCNINEPDYYYKIYDKNWSFVEFDIINKQFLFLYWFEEEGVSMIYVNNKFNSGCVKKTIVKYKKDKILGLGSTTLPLFSFGSTTIKLKSQQFSQDFIGVGHIKIIKNFKFDEASKINLFRNKLSSQLINKFGDNYIEHNSYFYLMFFFRLLKNEKGKYAMLISDSYLPINLDENNKYKFSIIFPMSIFFKNNLLNITAGEGDYYNIILSFDPQFVKNLCKHNVKLFDADKYNYSYLLCQNGKFNIVDDLK